MRLDLSVFIGCVMKKVFKIFVFVVLIIAALAAYLMPRYSNVDANHDVIPACPTVWPAYEEGYGSNYDDFYGEWYTIVSTDSNGYTIGRAYPRDSRYRVGYTPGTPHEICFIRMYSGEQILFPREIEDAPVSRPAVVPKPIKPEATMKPEPTAIPTLVPESTKVPVIPTLVPESTKVPVIPTLVPESTRVPVIPTLVPVIPTLVPVIPTLVPESTKVPDPTVKPTKLPYVKPTRPYVRPTKRPVVPTATPPGWHCHDYVGGSKREYLPHCHE